MKKSALLLPEVEKGRLNAGLDIDHPGEIDVPHERASIGLFEVVLQKRSVIDDRDAALLWVENVDQHALHTKMP